MDIFIIDNVPAIPLAVPTPGQPYRFIVDLTIINSQSHWVSIDPALTIMEILWSILV